MSSSGGPELRRLLRQRYGRVEPPATVSANVALAIRTVSRRRGSARYRVLLPAAMGLALAIALVAVFNAKSLAPRHQYSAGSPGTAALSALSTAASQPHTTVVPPSVESSMPIWHEDWLTCNRPLPAAKREGRVSISYRYLPGSQPRWEAIVHNGGPTAITLRYNGATVAGVNQRGELTALPMIPRLYAPDLLLPAGQTLAVAADFTLQPCGDHNPASRLPAGLHQVTPVLTYYERTVRQLATGEPFVVNVDASGLASPHRP